MTVKTKEVDMHLHSNFSDGIKSIRELVSLVSKVRMKAAILTDHDTIRGVRGFVSVCKKMEVDSMTGVEISSDPCFPCFYSVPFVSPIDILGYGFSLEMMEANYDDLLRHNISVRREYMARILYLYKRNGVMDFTLKSLRKHFNLPVKVANKYWIIAARVEQLENSGLKTFINSLDFARNELEDGGAYHVKRGRYVSVEDAVRAIKRCGGLAVWAHPSKTIEKIVKMSGSDNWEEIFHDLLKRMSRYGLDGLEIHTPHNSDGEMVEFLTNAGKKHKLKIFTGGSDYHGEYGLIDGCCVGDGGVSYKQFLEIKKLLPKFLF